MRPALRRFLLYALPLAGNLALIGYLVWQLRVVALEERHGDFLIFSVLYAVGGVVMVVSGITAFFQGTPRSPAARWLQALALVNTIVPTVLLVILLNAI